MNPIVLFCVGAGLSLVSVTAGAYLVLISQYVTRTGASPIPHVPRINLFRRKKHDDEDDTNGKPLESRVRTGP
jgi:hypothetical protein